MDRSAHCSCKGPEFGPQHPDKRDSQVPIILTPCKIQFSSLHHLHQSICPVNDSQWLGFLLSSPFEQFGWVADVTHWRNLSGTAFLLCCDSMASFYFTFDFALIALQSCDFSSSYQEAPASSANLLALRCSPSSSLHIASSLESSSLHVIPGAEGER